MYSIELKGFELKKCINYMAETYSMQPEQNITKMIAKCKRNNDNKKCLIYPGYSSFHWHHDNEVFEIQFLEEGKVQSAPDGLEYFTRLYMCHNDISKIQAFIEHIFNYKCELDDEDKVRLYVSKCGQYGAIWENFGNINVQTIDDIFIDKKLKENLLTYINNFVNSKEKYFKFGRNHKTNILLTGIPGSGKTSLCKALAKKYGYSIYIMNFTKNMTDSHLIDLISDVKENSIILYEDIDSYFTDRTSNDVNVSFSCLINILDGTLSKGSGIINVITTNFPDKLDSALLRPGRIDKIVEFDYPKKEEIREAFVSLIGSEDNFESFYCEIKHLKVTMAAIIEHLFRHPDNYLENMKDLINHVTFVHTVTGEDSSSKLYT